MLIVGAGNIAGLNEADPAREKPCTHAGAYMAHPGFDVVGAVDIDRLRAEYLARQFGIEAAFDNLGEAMKACNPDHVSVAVPYWLHHEVVIAAAEHDSRPTSIFCEKPISHSLASAEKMSDVCRSNDVSLYVNNRRMMPVYQKLKDILTQEFDDDIIAINGWASSGMHAVGIHLLDLMRFLCGDVETVFTQSETEYVESLPFSHNFTSDDPRLKALVVFENGVCGHLVNSALTEFTYFEIEVTCRRGKVRVSDNGNCLEIWRQAKPGTSTLSYRLNAPETVGFEQRPLFAALADALYTGAGAEDISGREGLETYRTLTAMVRSAKTGRPVAVAETRGMGT